MIVRASPRGQPVRLMSGAALALAACLAQAAPAGHTTHTVVIEGMTFKPAVIEVKAGDTIVWQNQDLVPHTVTATAQHIESGDVGANKSWSYRVRQPGTIEYICRFHPMMRARIVVTK